MPAHLAASCPTRHATITTHGNTNAHAPPASPRVHVHAAPTHPAASSCCGCCGPHKKRCMRNAPTRVCSGQLPRLLRASQNDAPSSRWPSRPDDPSVKLCRPPCAWGRDGHATQFHMASRGPQLAAQARHARMANRTAITIWSSGSLVPAAKAACSLRPARPAHLCEHAPPRRCTLSEALHERCTQPTLAAPRLLHTRPRGTARTAAVAGAGGTGPVHAGVGGRVC